MMDIYIINLKVHMYIKKNEENLQNAKGYTNRNLIAIKYWYVKILK